MTQTPGCKFSRLFAKGSTKADLGTAAKGGTVPTRIEPVRAFEDDAATAAITGSAGL